MKKSILGTLICVMLICVLVASLSFSAFATTEANITDTHYFISYVSAGNLTPLVGRYKTNYSRVYVAPERSPAGYTRAQVRCYVGKTMTNMTTANAGYVVLADGERYAIQNIAFQSGNYTTDQGVMTWLYIAPEIGSGILEGVWSPDWSGWTDNGQVKLV